MNFIKGLYEEGLVEQHLDEDAWADIRRRRIDRLEKQRNVALYGYLVGVENAMRAKRFAEMASQGKSVPANFVQAYLPIIDMIDDIIDGGPAAITQLRNLHKRFKK